MTFPQIMEHYKKIRTFDSLVSLVEWDTATMMPPQSGKLREEQLTALNKAVFELETDSSFYDSVFSMEDPKEEKDRAQLEILKISLQKKRALDSQFVERLSRQEVRTHHSWENARKENNFALVLPDLKEILQLKREMAARFLADPYLSDYFQGRSHYEVLMDDFEPGVKSHTIRELLKTLVQETQKRLDSILSKQKTPERPLLRVEASKQKEIVSRVVRDLGLKMTHARVDTSTHPFCSGHPLDTRLTTRYNENDLMDSLSSVIHETGHALYEQGLPKETLFRPGGNASSMGIHESQSRFYENFIGRSRGFCTYLSSVTGHTEQELFDTLNHVSKSFIRVDADELTYNLHIAMRMEIEEGLIDDFINIDELPNVWNEKFEEIFGKRPPNNLQGCLQDVHWYQGLVGYFPTYSYGNLIAAELFNDFRKEFPDWENKVAEGEFSFIQHYMSEKVHRFASFDRSPDNIKRIFPDRPLGVQAFCDYIDEKYS